MTTTQDQRMIEYYENDIKESESRLEKITKNKTQLSKIFYTNCKARNAKITLKQATKMISDEKGRLEENINDSKIRLNEYILRKTLDSLLLVTYLEEKDIEENID